MKEVRGSKATGRHARPTTATQAGDAKLMKQISHSLAPRRCVHFCAPADFRRTPQSGLGRPFGFFLRELLGFVLGWSLRLVGLECRRPLVFSVVVFLLAVCADVAALHGLQKQ